VKKAAEKAAQPEKEPRETALSKLQTAHAELIEERDRDRVAIRNLTDDNARLRAGETADGKTIRERIDQEFGGPLNMAMELPAEDFAQGMIDLECGKDDLSYPQQVMEELRRRLEPVETAPASDRLQPIDHLHSFLDREPSELANLILEYCGENNTQLLIIGLQSAVLMQQNPAATAATTAAKVAEGIATVAANAAEAAKPKPVVPAPKAKRRRKTLGEHRAEKAAAAADPAPDSEIIEIAGTSYKLTCWPKISGGKPWTIERDTGESDWRLVKSDAPENRKKAGGMYATREDAIAAAAGAPEIITAGTVAAPAIFADAIKTGRMGICPVCLTVEPIDKKAGVIMQHLHRGQHCTGTLQTPPPRHGRGSPDSGRDGRGSRDYHGGDGRGYPPDR
jgi:hypothetical protein